MRNKQEWNNVASGLVAYHRFSRSNYEDNINKKNVSYERIHSMNQTKADFVSVSNNP